MNHRDKLLENFGRRVRDARLARGLTQEQLAALAGFDPSPFLTHIKAPSKFVMRQISCATVVFATNILKEKKGTESKRFTMRDG